MDISILKSTALIAVLVLLALAADFLVKTASEKEAGYYTWYFIASLPFVIVAAFGWLQAMRMETLAGIGVLEAAISLLGLIIMSVFVFGEVVKPATFIAASLALTAVITQTFWG